MNHWSENTGLLDWPEDHYAVVTNEGEVHLWRRVRPDPWWGIAYLPETWAVGIVLFALLWSLRRDRKGLPRPDAP